MWFWLIVCIIVVYKCKKNNKNDSFIVKLLLLKMFKLNKAIIPKVELGIVKKMEGEH
jgi:hypothetical protein